MSGNLARHLLLTGPPGCGKTTLIERLAREMAALRPAGFVTREIREGGVRKGFRLIGLDGRQGILAHVDFSGPRVGHYGVDVAGFEAFLEALNLEHAASPFLFIDEIGRMECLSPSFVALVRKLLASGRTVVATVALRGSGFIAEVKEREDCELVTIEAATRERMPAALLERLRKGAE